MASTESHAAPELRTEETYRKVLTAASIPFDVEKVEDFSLLWLGSRTAKSVILSMHGGGFVGEAYETHFQWLLNGWKVMTANSQDVAIAFLDYGLAPKTPYPGQIRQGVSAVNHLLKTRPAENISLYGDSVGGVLVTSILLQKSHPHPLVPALSLPSPSSRFHEAFIVSLGSCIITSAPSMTDNQGKDFVALETLTEITKVLDDSKEAGVEIVNPWHVPVTAEEEWWKGLPVGNITLTAGENELWRDDILAVGERIKKYHDREVVVLCGKGEVHVGALIDFASGAEDKVTAKLWKQWFQEFKA